MSGHSHWAGIKHKKAAIDAKRGRLWSKLARNIIVAAKAGGGDPDGNLSLRYAIDKAKAANMPRDTIEKSVKKGTGELESENFEEILYEGYGTHGVAIMCQVLTNNRNRTAGEIRKIFDTRGGSLGATNCVAWMFAKKGLITVNTRDVEEDALMDLALEAGADDVQTVGDTFEITCPIEAFENIKKALQQKSLATQVAEISYIPSTYVTLDESGAQKIIDLMEILEDHEDVQNVYANFDIPEAIIKKLETKS
jgi:YebC/PmpR family DNA-binding regulatory protein